MDDLLTLQLKALEVYTLREQVKEQRELLRQAQRLMRAMDAKNRKLVRDRNNLLMCLRAVHNSFWFFALPRAVRTWVIGWVRAEPF